MPDPAHRTCDALAWWLSDHQAKQPASKVPEDHSRHGLVWPDDAAAWLPTTKPCDQRSDASHHVVEGYVSRLPSEISGLTKSWRAPREAVSASVARALTVPPEESPHFRNEEARHFLLRALLKGITARPEPDPWPVPLWPPTLTLSTTRFDQVTSSMPVTGATIDRWLGSVKDTVAATPELAFADWVPDPESWATVGGFAASASDWAWAQVQEIASYLRVADASPFHASRHRDGAIAPTPGPGDEPGQDSQVALTSPISANAPNGGPSGPHETEVYLAA